MEGHISSQENDSKLKGSISEIDKSERQNLFETFVAHGGQVIDKKPKVTGSTTAGVDQNKGSRNTVSMSSFAEDVDRTKSTQDAILNFQSKDIARKTVLVSDAYIDKVKKRQELKGFNSIVRRWSAFLSGITNISGTHIQAKFSRETYIMLAEDIANLKAITNFIVGTPLFRRVDIIKSFSSTYPIFTEMILRINSLKLDPIISKFKSQKSMSLEVCKIYYFMIIKSFFPFLGRKDMLQAGYIQCFRVLKQLQLYNKQFLAKEEENLNKAIKVIFDTYLPKLNKLYPLLIQKDAEIISPISKHTLELTENDFLGSWSSKIREMIMNAESKVEDSEKQLGEEVETKDINSVNEAQEQGLKMINTIVFNPDLLTSEVTNYPQRDKIFHTIFLLDYCAKRYWILNNRKYIEYKPAQENGERFSLEILINEFFMSIEKFHVSLKNYTQILTSLTAFTSDIDAPKDNLIAISKDEENLQEMRLKLSKQLRDQAIGFISAIVIPLGQRRDQFSRYVQNPDMKFDPSLFPNNPFLEYTPLGILQDFYQFITAFHYLLTRGELSGRGNSIPSDSNLLHLRDE